MTGIAVIDEEHRRLFEMINQAAEELREAKRVSREPNETVQALVEALREYAATHLAHEEAYMEQIQDPELPRQKKEHKLFLERMNGLKQDLTEQKSSCELLGELLEYLSRWLYHHILGSDILIGKMGTTKEEDPFAFTEKFKTGIGLVDDEHKRLFEIIRDTDRVIHAELLHDKFDEIVRLLSELKDYTVFHFSDEEAYMESIGYDGLQAQKNAHQAFVDRLNEINLDDVDDNQDEYLEELIRFLLGWLVNHILLLDKKIPVGK